MSNLNNKSILWQAQEVVAGMLNSDEVLSGRVSFFPENSKEIDFELQNALGKQGIVGIVMTPQAEYRGTFQGEEIVWDLIDFTVQVVENPAVNRPLSGSMTALDAAMRASECLAYPLLSSFGTYCPKTVDQGEDSGLLVAQAKFDTTIRASREPVPPAYEDNVFVYSDGTAVKMSSGTTLAAVPKSVGSYGLVQADIADHVDTLASNVFDGCTSLSSVEFGSSLSSIGGYAFNRCSRLSSVDLPASLKVFSGEGTFLQSGLTSISVPAGVAAVPGNFAFNCQSLKTVELPDSVQTIGRYAFGYCPLLDSLVFPASLSSIGTEAFSYDSACLLFDFSRCQQVPTLGSSAFAYTSQSKQIVVPQALYSEWIGAAGWSELSDFIVSDGDSSAPEPAPELEIPDAI